MSYVAVMHLHPVAFRRDERGRVVVLAFLMLVLVSSVALVGNSDRDGDGDAAVISASANVVQSEASLLSRLQNYPGILARAGSFQRLSTAEQPAQLPVANTGWGSVDAQAGAAQAAAFEQQQMMQEQENVAKTEAAAGLMEHVLGITNPAMLAGMPKALQNLVFKASIHAATAGETPQESAEAMAAAQSGRLGAGQLASLAGQMGGGDALARVLARQGAVHGLSPAQMMAAAQTLPHAPSSMYQQQTGVPQQGQQQLQEAQAAAEEVSPEDQAVAPQAAFQPAAIQPVQPTAVKPQGYVQPQEPAPVATAVSPEEWAPAPEYEPVAPAAQETVAPAGPGKISDDYWSKEFVIVHPHPNLDKRTFDDDMKVLQLIGMVAFVIAMTCCACALLGRPCCKKRVIKHAGGSGSFSGNFKPSPTGKSARSPRMTGAMLPARGLDDYEKKSGGGESSASLALALPEGLEFLQRGFNTIQGGIGDFADAAMNAAAVVSNAPFEEDDESPYSVVVSFCRDARGNMGMDAASDIYDHCTARGFKTLLLPSDPNWEKGSDYDKECLANIAVSALFVALVDDEWVREDAHLRVLSVAVQCLDVRCNPRIFIVYDKELRYKEELALRTFKLTGSNSAAIRRHEGPEVPYRLLDQVFETKGVWSGLMLGDPVDRGLTEEEGAAILGGALPLEARLKCNVGRRTSILNASDAANQGGGFGSHRLSMDPGGQNQMILPTFTRPDIRFNPYIH